MREELENTKGSLRESGLTYGSRERGGTVGGNQVLGHGARF